MKNIELEDYLLVCLLVVAALFMLACIGVLFIKFFVAMVCVVIGCVLVGLISLPIYFYGKKKGWWY